MMLFVSDVVKNPEYNEYKKFQLNMYRISENVNASHSFLQLKMEIIFYTNLTKCV
jgi:hypothetical protein